MAAAVSEAGELNCVLENKVEQGYSLGQQMLPKAGRLTSGMEKEVE